MLKKFMLRFVKSILAEVVEQILQSAIDEAQEEIDKIEQMTEKERAASRLALDLVEERLVKLLDEKLAGL